MKNLQTKAQLLLNELVAARTIEEKKKVVRRIEVFKKEYGYDFEKHKQRKLT